MKFEPTPIAGVTVIHVEPQGDERGSFARSYCTATFRAAGLTFGAIRQASISHNRRRGSLRGMHWQVEPKPEGKIVRVTAGRVYDVVLDLRPASASYLKWFARELDAIANDALLIPPGCAHGFLTLADDSVVSYMMDADFDAALARGVRWDDAVFAIAWPFRPEVMSERDRTWPDYRPARAPFS